jgi:hypothetical protein
VDRILSIKQYNSPQVSIARQVYILPQSHATSSPWTFAGARERQLEDNNHRTTIISAHKIFNGCKNMFHNSNMVSFAFCFMTFSFCGEARRFWSVGSVASNFLSRPQNRKPAVRRSPYIISKNDLSVLSQQILENRVQSLVILFLFLFYIY